MHNMLNFFFLLLLWYYAVVTLNFVWNFKKTNKNTATKVICKLWELVCCSLFCEMRRKEANFYVLCSQIHSVAASSSYFSYFYLFSSSSSSFCFEYISLPRSLSRTVAIIIIYSFFFSLVLALMFVYIS